MRNVLRLGPALLAGLVCAAPVAAQVDEAQPIDTSTCHDVSGQAEIDGIMQPYTGQACRQPDGTWVFVNGYGQSGVMQDYAYDYAPWYFAPPVLFGGAFIFFAPFHRHHHHHHFDQDRFGHLFDRDFGRDRFGHHPDHIVAMPSGVPPARPSPRVAVPPVQAQAPHMPVTRPNVPVQAEHAAVMPRSGPAQTPHWAVMPRSAPAQAPHWAVTRPIVPAQAQHMTVMRPIVPAQAGRMGIGGYGGVVAGGHASGGRVMGSRFGGGMNGR